MLEYNNINKYYITLTNINNHYLITNYKIKINNLLENFLI